MEIALFSPSSLFAGDDCDSPLSGAETNAENSQTYDQRTHAFPGMDLLIREFSFHQFNANLLWPGSFAFAEWLVQHKSLLEGRHIIELGSGTGALAVFLRRSSSVDITTSDFDDEEIEENIAHNCRANGLTVLPHIRHSWANNFPITEPDWDLIIASDILLYVKQYPNLIKTLSFLLKSYRPKNGNTGRIRSNQENTIGVELPWPTFLMSWRRRIGKDDEALFFNGCEEAGLAVEHLGSRVYRITPKKMNLIRQRGLEHASD